IHQHPVVVPRRDGFGTHHRYPHVIHGGAFDGDRAEGKHHVLHHLHHSVHFGNIPAPSFLVLRGRILVSRQQVQLGHRNILLRLGTHVFWHRDRARSHFQRSIERRCGLRRWFHRGNSPWTGTSPGHRLLSITAALPSPPVGAIHPIRQDVV